MNSSDLWKRLKKELHKFPEKKLNQGVSHQNSNIKSKSPCALHTIPNRILKNIFQSSIPLEKSLSASNSSPAQKPTRALDASILEKNVGPCCFLGCHSPHDLTLFYNIIEKMKINPYSLFHIGLYIIEQKKDNKNPTQRYEAKFCNVLEIEKILSVTKDEDYIHKAPSLGQALHTIKAPKIYLEVLNSGQSVGINFLQSFSNDYALNLIHSLNSNQLTLIQSLQNIK